MVQSSNVHSTIQQCKILKKLVINRSDEFQFVVCVDLFFHGHKLYITASA